MEIFSFLSFRDLPMDAHFKFFERATKEIADADPDIQSALGPLVAELNSWFARETAGIKWARKSALTALIAAAAERLDRALSGLSAQVRSARHSTKPDVSSAAERLRIMLKNYGQVSRKPYLQEAGATDAILSHLNGDLATDALTAGVEGWTQEIQNARNSFISLFEQREAQILGKPQQRFLVVRRGIESVWHRIVTLVNSGAALNLSPGYATLIRALNPEIESFNSEFHRIRHNIAAAQPSPIEQQPCTGIPCTPMPEVFYPAPKGPLRLELGRDFNITYKNNIDPGNATCTIHGKGRYKGLKSVTFTIARPVSPV
jgi:hypothetical protein